MQREKTGTPWWGGWEGEQPTIDELPGRQTADPQKAQSVLASCLTYAQRDAAPALDNDAVAEALYLRLAAEGWRLTRSS